MGLAGCLSVIDCSGLGSATLPEAPPAALGFDGERLKRIDAAIDNAIASSQVPGVVVLVGAEANSLTLARPAAGRSSQLPKR